jgi:hypothetical protein
MLGLPRLVPRTDSVLQRADNLIGDGLINISDGSPLSVLVAAAAATLPVGETGVARARRLRMRNVEAPPEGPFLQGIRVDAAFRVGMPCAREGRLPLRKPKREMAYLARF